jgi:hypothetical protein
MTSVSWFLRVWLCLWLLAATTAGALCASPIAWSVEVLPAELSSHQRLLAGVSVEFRHPVSEKVTASVRFEDSDGKVWENRDAVDHDFIQYAFVLPGDYAVSVEIRHVVVSKKLHVSPLKTEPLPDLWAGLPRVEFITSNPDSPDAWFLPEIESRLHLPVETRNPVHIDVLVNTTPGERFSAESGGAAERNLSVLIPALKVVSQLELRHGTMDSALLDLTRRRDAGVQTWEGMKAFLARSNPRVVDVGALSGQWKMRNFFLERLTSRVREPDRVAIVLSGPAFFEDQEPAAPVELPEGVAPRVFYIRCRDIPRWMLEPRPRPRPGARPRPSQRASFALPLDDLEKPLATPGARVFDVITPEQFRRVLAAVIEQISRM